MLNKGGYRFMQEAEVSLRVALHFIMNGITKENVETEKMLNTIKIMLKIKDTFLAKKAFNIK